MKNTGTFCNWSGLVQVKPRDIVSPENLAELQLVVSRSPKLRMVGTGHSFNACAATEETLVLSERLQRVIWIDKEKKQVKVEAGIKLRDLNPLLWREGLAFPSLGDIDQQAMGGLVATGTHGTGLKWGSFCDARSLIAMELVLADGSLLELRSDRQDDRPILAAARLSLGALGVIYSLTFQVEEAHHLECHSQVMTEAQALAGQPFATLDHFEFFPFPFTDKVLAVSRHKSTKPADRHRYGAWFNDLFMENIVLDSVLRLTAWRPSKVPALMHLISKLAKSEHHVGRSYEVMASQRRIRFYEMEFAFALDRYEAALATYHQVNRYFAERQDAFRYFASFPGEMRFLGGDQGTLLSPTLGAPTCYLAAQVHPAFGSAYRAYFQTLETEFWKLGGRPHWGKLFDRNPMDQYPGFEAWLQVRKTLDAQNKFENDFLKKLLNGEPVGAF